MLPPLLPLLLPLLTPSAASSAPSAAPLLTPSAASSDPSAPSATPPLQGVQRVSEAQERGAGAAAAVQGGTGARARVPETGAATDLKAAAGFSDVAVARRRAACVCCARLASGPSAAAARTAALFSNSAWLCHLLCALAPLHAGALHSGLLSCCPDCPAPSPPSLLPADGPPAALHSLC